MFIERSREPLGSGLEIPVWLVYREAKRVDVFYLKKNPDQPVASYSLGQSFHSPLFPELEISIDKIFAR